MPTRRPHAARRVPAALACLLLVAGCSSPDYTRHKRTLESAVEAERQALARSDAKLLQEAVAGMEGLLQATREERETFSQQRFYATYGLARLHAAAAARNELAFRTETLGPSRATAIDASTSQWPHVLAWRSLARRTLDLLDAETDAPERPRIPKKMTEDQLAPAELAELDISVDVRRHLSYHELALSGLMGFDERIERAWPALGLPADHLALDALIARDEAALSEGIRQYLYVAGYRHYRLTNPTYALRYAAKAQAVDPDNLSAVFKAGVKAWLETDVRFECNNCMRSISQLDTLHPDCGSPIIDMAVLIPEAGTR